MFDLPMAGVVRVTGRDAATVVNNLTTNDVKKLSANTNCQSFITNVRGWAIAFGFLCKLENEVWYLGQLHDSEALCRHIDKYIVREDAKVEDLSQSDFVLLLNVAEAAVLSSHWEPHLELTEGRVHRTEFASAPILLAAVEFLGPDNLILVCNASYRGKILDGLQDMGIALDSRDEFERGRIQFFWPSPTSEILEKSIPQELDRDAKAISFTKGCYLGQETIARLDARGQLQKKLCLIAIEGRPPIDPGASVQRSEQIVGNITSLSYSESNDCTFALAYLRRGNFDIGTPLICAGVTAKVIEP
jgi:tRNA-modifying protein YgfZ